MKSDKPIRPGRYIEFKDNDMTVKTCFCHDFMDRKSPHTGNPKLCKKFETYQDYCLAGIVHLLTREWVIKNFNHNCYRIYDEKTNMYVRSPAATKLIGDCFPDLLWMYDRSPNDPVILGRYPEMNIYEARIQFFKESIKDAKKLDKLFKKHASVHQEIVEV